MIAALEKWDYFSTDGYATQNGRTAIVVRVRLKAQKRR